MKETRSVERNETLKAVLKSVVEMKEVKDCGEIVFAYVGGSISSNLAKYEDKVFGFTDFDVVFVYLADPLKFFGLKQFENLNFRKQATLRNVQTAKDVVSVVQVDIVGMEMKTYLNHIANLNPNIVESLFLVERDRFAVYNESVMRELFLLANKEVMCLDLAKKYIGYGRSQFQDSERENWKLKPLYHSFRVLFEANEIITNSKLIVYFDDLREERLFLMKIREGEINLNNIKSTFFEKKDEIELKLKNSKEIKDKPSSEFFGNLESFLIRLRVEKIKRLQ